MAEPITATEAARRFSDLLDRTHHRGESFIILQGGEEAGRLVPPEPPPQAAPTLKDLILALRDIGPPDEDFAKDLAEIRRNQPPMPEDPWGSS